MKLEDIYEKLNVGDKLWADIEGEQREDWGKFISKLYAPDFEPNTDDEKKVLKALTNYFRTNKSGELGVY